MPKQAIPTQVKAQVDAIVKNFNQRTFTDPQQFYLTRYRGPYLYLDRYDFGSVLHICRLTYTDSLTNWEFAIFKYSDEVYDAHEWFFPGAGFVDGTIEGAMKAGLEAYP
jgi:hypothetical protein